MPKIKCDFEALDNCNQIWHKLETIAPQNRVKFCAHCKNNVHWCDSPEEVFAAIEDKKCLAAHCDTLDKANVKFSPRYLGKSNIVVGGVDESAYKPGSDTESETSCFDL